MGRTESTSTIWVFGLDPSGTYRGADAHQHRHPFERKSLMSLWLGLLIAAVVLGILGFAVAKWLFIVAVILLIAGLVGIGNGRRSRL
jgi:hypothetical protein